MSDTIDTNTVLRSINTMNMLTNDTNNNIVMSNDTTNTIDMIHIPVDEMNKLDGLNSIVDQIDEFDELDELDEEINKLEESKKSYDDPQGVEDDVNFSNDQLFNLMSLMKNMPREQLETMRNMPKDDLMNSLNQILNTNGANDTNADNMNNMNNMGNFKSVSERQREKSREGLKTKINQMKKRRANKLNAATSNPVQNQNNKVDTTKLEDIDKIVADINKINSKSIINKKTNNRRKKQ